MFLQLYNRSHEKVAGLAVAKAAQIESVLSTGDKTLSFSYPLNQAAGLVNEAYLRTETDEFVIKEVLPDSTNAWVSVKAVLNVEALQGQCWPKFESVEQKIDDSLTLAIAGTGWTIGSCTVTKRRTIRKTGCSTWEIISQAKKTYNCDIWFDSLEKKIHIAEKRGEDKGAYFTDNLNLKRLAIQSTSYDFCTRIRAEGKDGLTFADINGGKNYVENHQYSDKNLEIYWKDERYTVAESLKEDAEAKLNELSKPVVAYSGDVLDLAKASPKTYRILDFGLGDTVELVDSTTGTKEKQRIVKMVEYPDEPERNTCEFANRTASFEELQQEQNEVNSTVNNITADDGTISPSALDLDAITIHVQNIYAQELNAVKARIGELETTTLKATEAIISTAKIEELLAGKATILDLNALTARVEVAEIKVGYVDTLITDVADIKTLVNGNLTSVNIQAGGITSDSLTIRNGFIESAMIGSVEAGKITTGILNTSLVTVQGADGRMAIKDNTIQIKDASRVRVQIGKDAAGDYSMYVWDAAGALMFDAAGLHAPGIKSGIIRNDMVADNAGIAGTKIDIVSLITSINGNTTKIDSTVIKMDSSGQTLNLAFNTLKTTAETAKNTTETHTTQINAINGKIDTLIQDTTIVKDGQTVKLKDEYNKTVATVGGIQTTIGNQQTTIANLTNDLNNLSIGGRNYILNTAFLKGTEGFLPNQSVVLSIIKEGEKDVLKGVSSQASSTPGIKFFINLDEGGKYLLSFIGKGINTTGYVISVYNEQATERIDTKEYTVNTASFSNSTTLFNMPKAGRYCIIIFWIADGTEKGLLIQGSSLKLEKGNKPTDWTPAPEDAQGQIKEVKTQQATFEQTLNGFSTTVSSLQTTVNGKADAGAVNTLNSRVTSLETNLDGFKTNVSNTYTTKTDFNNLSVGGRNLLKKSEHIYLSSSDFPTITTRENGKITVNAQGNWNAYTWVHALFPDSNYVFKDCVGKDFAYSVDVKTNKAGASAYIDFRNGSQKPLLIRMAVPNTGNKWIRISGTGKLGNNVVATGSLVVFEGSNQQGLILEYKNFKLELGNKGTDWTPAPEDVDASITAVDSKFANYSTTSQMNSAIDQKANQITQTVSQTYTTKTEFGNLQVGGANLYKDTYFKTTAHLGWYSSTGATGSFRVDANSKTMSGRAVQATYLTDGAQGPYYKDDIPTLQSGKTYTWQVLVFCSKAIAINIGVETAGGSKSINLAANTWTKVTHTFTASVTEARAFHLYPSTTMNSGNYLIFGDLKIEEGSKATTWSPAPEDIDKSITAVDSKFASYSTTTQMNSAIDQKANQITQTVSQTYTTKTEFNNSAVKQFNNFSRTGNLTGWAPAANASGLDGVKLQSNSTYNWVGAVTTSGNVQIYSDFYEVDANKSYKLGLTINKPAATGQIYFGITCYNASKQAVGVYTGTSTTLNTNFYYYSTSAVIGGWLNLEGYLMASNIDRAKLPTGKNVSICAVMHPTTKYVRIRFLNYYNSGTSSTMYFAHPFITDAENSQGLIETRVSTAEQKLTATSLITTITTGINGGTKFTTTKFIMDNTGLTIKGGGIKIQNNAGANVLYGDTSGNLVFGGTLSQVSTSTSKTGIEIKNGQINMRAWQNGDIAAGSFIGYGGGGETGVNFAMVANGQFGVNDSSGYYMLKIRNSRIHELYGDWFDVKAKLHCFSNVLNKYNQEYGIFIGSDYIYQMRLSGNPNWYIHCDTNIGAYGVSIWASDGRMKANIQPTQVSALDEIARFKHRAFQWKDGGHFEKIGYIAQELEQIDPDYVERIPQKDMNGNILDYRLQINEHRIIPLLTKAMQELAEENKELRRQIQYILQRTGIGSVPAPVSRMAFAAEYVPQYPEGIRYYVPPEPEPIQPPRAV